MNDDKRKQLLDCLLGALDESEQAEIESRLKDEPDYRLELARLETRLRKLEAMREEEEVAPPGLSDRTCRFVFAQLATPASLGTSLSPQVSPPSWVHRMTRLDFAMAAAVVLIACGLIAPAVENSRYRTHVAACQDNLRGLGAALNNYSQAHGGYFPNVPTQGKLASAGIYAPVLLQNGLIKEAGSFVCPDSRLAAKQRGFSIPTFSELELKPQVEVEALRPTIGGSYAYNLGYTRDGQYYPTKNLYRDSFPVMADAPSNNLANLQSDNHRGRGQNVLTESGAVQFVVNSKPFGRDDDIYLNNAGQVAAGIGSNDVVLGGSGATPIQFVSGVK